MILASNLPKLDPCIYFIIGVIICLFMNDIRTHVAQVAPLENLAHTLPK